MADPVSHNETGESYANEGLLIDLSPAELNRSLQTDHCNTGRKDTTVDDYVPIVQQRASTPSIVKRSIRTKRLPKAREPKEISDHFEMSEPMMHPEQRGNSPMSSMKSMMDQMSQTMKAFQNMMEATTLTLKHVHNSSHTRHQRQCLFKIDANNNKSSIRDFHNISRVDSDGDSDSSLDKKLSILKSTDKLCPERSSTEKPSRWRDHSQSKSVTKQGGKGQGQTNHSSRALSAEAPVFRPKQNQG